MLVSVVLGTIPEKCENLFEKRELLTFQNEKNFLFDLFIIKFSFEIVFHVCRYTTKTCSTPRASTPWKIVQRTKTCKSLSKILPKHACFAGFSYYSKQVYIASFHISPLTSESHL